MSIGKPLYFISDLHLSAGDPRTQLRFQAFVNGLAKEAGQLYILGDLFDAWLGDDQLRRDAFARGLAAQLAALNSLGCQVFLQRGNRDFSLGYRFAQAARAVLLPELHVISLGKTRTVLLHGDELCIHDHLYQRYRKVIRNPLVLGTLLALPFQIRQQLATRLRADRPGPQLDTKAGLDPYDADPAFAERLAREHQANVVIHGHTHRPADHAPQDPHGVRRIVLSDWQYGEGVLRVDIDDGTARFSVVPWAEFEPINST